MSQKPTQRQSEYLAFIQAFTERWRIPPSFEEIAAHFGTTPPSVNGMIKTLESRGFLTRVPGAPRTLRVLVTPEPAVGEPAAAAPADVTAAVTLGSMVIERLVPALRGADRNQLFAAIEAVAAAVDVACTTAGASEGARKEAREALRRVAIAAQGQAPPDSPRARTWQPRGGR